LNVLKGLGVLASLFTDEAFESYRLPPDKVPVVKGHRTIYLTEGATLRDFITKLHTSDKLWVDDSDEALGAPSQGAFALFKKLDHQRLVSDFPVGNSPYHMPLVQARYQRLLDEHPGLAELHDLGPKVMNICHPTVVAGLPPGAACKTSGDFRSYFYQFAQLLVLRLGQKYCNVPGHWVGHSAPWVAVGLSALGMGSWVAALLAHLFHRALLLRAYATPLCLVRPEFASPEHQDAVAHLGVLAAAEEDGRVPWGLVPPAMRAAMVECLPGDCSSVLASPRLEKLRVPLTALAFEMVPRAQAIRRPRHEWIEVHTSVLCGNNDSRQKVAATLARNRGTAWAHLARFWHVVATVYQDDSDGFVYPPSPANTKAELLAADQVGDAHRLFTTLYADSEGVVQNFTKLRFASRETTATLGVDVAFLPGGELRHEVNWQKRRRTIHALAKIAHSPRVKVVDVELLRSLLGDAIWQLLPRRGLLSILDIIFKALESSNRPDDGVVNTPGLRREIWLLMLLLPVASTHSTIFSDVLYCFDASGKSKDGTRNGGYGAASRAGLTQEVATELLSNVDPGCGALPLFTVQEDGSPPAARLADARHAKIATTATRFLQYSWKDRKGAWSVVRSGAFRTPPRHVTKAELATGSMTFQRAARTAQATSKTVVLGGDNQPADLMILKGRSSVRDLNQICRTICARSLVFDVLPAIFWMPSKANPADGPSRWEELKQQLGRRFSG
jgi:hypothetical protein